MLRRTFLLSTLTSCQFLYSPKDNIKVGVLHSLSGSLALSETPVMESTLLAIQEINARGGVLNRPIEPIVRDGSSDARKFAEIAEQMIVKDNVVTIFGCWTSASRKTLLPVLKKYDHLLVYPLQYEGLESSPHIIYTGAAPNQQIIPGVRWALKNIGKRIYLVGSDYVFPRTANTIIRAQIDALGGSIVGEDYFILGAIDVEGVVKKIKSQQPDLILNTINGDTNIAFFRALRSAGITPQNIPTMSFSIGENELSKIGASEFAGDYAAWNYFQSIDTQANNSFVQQFQKRYGNDRVLSDPMEAAYFGVNLWAQGVVKKQSLIPRDIREGMRDQSFAAPGGVVYIDPINQHTWKTVRIGKILATGQFEIVWSSDRPVPPNPYPIFRTETEWQTYLQNLYQNWGGRWENQR